MMTNYFPLAKVELSKIFNQRAKQLHHNNNKDDEDDSNNKDGDNNNSNKDDGDDDYGARDVDASLAPGMYVLSFLYPFLLYYIIIYS